MSTASLTHCDPEDRPQRLPLRDAMLKWSEPALVKAVVAAEADFTPDELDRLEGDQVERFVALLSVSAGRSVAVADARLAQKAALYLAWNAVIADFLAMAARNEVILEGVWVNPKVLSNRIRLSVADVSKVEFRVRRATLDLDGRLYEDVTATLPPPDPLDDLRAKAAADGAIELPLREALIVWPEISLVKRVRRLERFIADVRGRPLKHTRLCERPSSPVDWSDMPWSDQRDAEKALDDAWHGLLLDFRRKIETGGLIVSGVQTWPTRRTTRELLPGVSAADFRFDVEAGKLDIVQFMRATYTFVAVNVSTRPPVERPTTHASMSGGGYWPNAGLLGGAIATQAQPAEAKPPTTTESSKRRRGRPAFPKDVFVEIAKTRTRAINNKEEAIALLVEMELRYPELKRPSYRTVCDHVDDIYTKAAPAKTTVKS